MKFLIAFIAFALVALFVPQAESCKVSCDPYSTTQVCGKFHTRCMRFANTCKRKLYNCVHNVAYKAVDISRCSNIGVGTHSTCSAATSSTSVAFLNTGNSLSGVNGFSGVNGLSSLSGYPSVTPIIIRV